MRKGISILLALCLVLPFAGCSNSTTESDIDNHSAVVTDETTESDSSSNTQQQKEKSTSQDSLENTYQIIIDETNVANSMNLCMVDDVLYAEAASYFDSISQNGYPVLYYEYDESLNAAAIYSWATDVMMMYFPIDTNTGYVLTDTINDQFEPITMDEKICMNSENDVLIPVKVMTEYLISSDKFTASVREAE